MLQEEINRWKEKYATVANDLLPRAQSDASLAKEDLKAAQNVAKAAHEEALVAKQKMDQMRVQAEQVRSGSGWFAFSVPIITLPLSYGTLLVHSMVRYENASCVKQFGACTEGEASAEGGEYSSYGAQQAESAG